MDKEHLEADESGELPDSDSDDIYDDIADFDLGKEVDKLKAENSMLEKHIASLNADVDKLTKAIVTLRKTQENLARNISSLYLTAKAEIERKNRQIADLQRELDDIKFRRKRPVTDTLCQPQKRAKYENDDRQTDNSRLAHTIIDSHDKVEKMSTRHKESNRPLTQFSRRKQGDCEESRDYKKERYEGHGVNHDHVGNRHATPDSEDRKSDVENSRLENRLGKDRESSRQLSRSRKQEEYEDTRGYREERYEGLNTNQKRVRHNDQAGDRYSTPDSEDRKSDNEASWIRERENTQGKDREGDRQLGRNRQEDEEMRGYRERRYGEFNNERRDRKRPDHARNRSSWGYHKERDTRGDRGYREGRGGVRERVGARDRNFARDRDSSRERASNHERDRGRSRDKGSRSERNSSRESRHKNEDDPKDETPNNEMKATVIEKQPENTEVFQKDVRSHVQVSKMVARKKLKVVQQLEESMSRSPRKMLQNTKLNVSSELSIDRNAQSKVVTSDEKDLSQKKSASDGKIRVLSNIILSDGSDQKGEATQSTLAKEPFGTNSSTETEISDDLTQIQNFLNEEGLKFRNKDKNKVNNKSTTESAVGTDSETKAHQVESKSTDGDRKNKGDSLKKITFDAYKGRNQYLKSNKCSEEETEKNNEPSEDLKTREEIQKDLEAEGLIFRNRDRHSTAVVKEIHNINTEGAIETKCSPNEAVKHNMKIEMGTETGLNEESGANEDINRKEASVGLLLLGIKEDIKPTTEDLLSEEKSSNFNVKNNNVETSLRQIDVIGSNEDVKVSTKKDTMGVERNDKKGKDSDSIGNKKSKRHTTVLENKETTTAIEADNNRSATDENRNSSENINTSKSKVQPKQINDVIVIDESSESRDTVRKNNVEEKELALNTRRKSKGENISVGNNLATRGVRKSPRKKSTGKQSDSSGLREKIKNLFDDSMDISDVSTNTGDDQKSRATKANKSNIDLKTDNLQVNIKQISCQEMRGEECKDVNRDSNSCKKKNSDLEKNELKKITPSSSMQHEKHDRKSRATKTDAFQVDIKQNSGQKIKIAKQKDVDRDSNYLENNEHKKITSSSSIQHENLKHPEKATVQLEEQKEIAKLSSSPKRKKVAEQNSSSYSQKTRRSKSSCQKSESEQKLENQKTGSDKTLEAGFEKLHRQIDALVAGAAESQKVSEVLPEKIKPSKKMTVANTKQNVQEDISSVKKSEETDNTKGHQTVLGHEDAASKQIAANDSQAIPHVIAIEKQSGVTECKASFSCLNNSPKNSLSPILAESHPSHTPDNRKTITRKRITPTPVTDTNKPASFGDILKKCETPVVAKVTKTLLIEHNLHLTHEGDIPLLHIEESHIDSLPNEDLRNPDSSLMRLLDTMTMSNMECELPKAHEANQGKEQGSVARTSSTELSFENLMYKVSSSPVHVTSATSLDAKVSCSNVNKNNDREAISTNVNVNSIADVSSSCTNGSGVVNASGASVSAGTTVNLSSGSTSGTTAKTPMKRKRRLVRLIITD